MTANNHGQHATSESEREESSQLSESQRFWFSPLFFVWDTKLTAYQEEDTVENEKTFAGGNEWSSTSAIKQGDSYGSPRGRTHCTSK